MAKKATAEAEVDFSDEEVGLGEGSMTVDLSGVDESGDFPVVPRGLYPCYIHDCVFKYSEASGNPMWELTLQVVPGHEYENSRFWFYITFHEEGLPRAKKAIARFAPELLEGPFDPEVVAEEGTLLERRLRAKVDIRPYQGKKRNNVKDILPAEEGDAFLEG
jgi:hypothetical protein